MYKILISLAVIFTALNLTSCATGYGKSGFLSNGYNDTKLSATSYKVEYSGNEVTPLQSTYEFAMRRSAELAQANGYEYFVVTDKKNLLIDASYDTRYGMRRMIVPRSILKIQFVNSKSGGAYTVKDVLARAKA